MSYRVRVNPITCEAHGMCAELLPERIALDEWGYPVVGGDPLAPELLAHARRAVQACPTFALLLERTANAEQARPARPTRDEPGARDAGHRRRRGL